MEELKETILRLGQEENTGLNGWWKYLYALIACLPQEEADRWLEQYETLPYAVATRLSHGERSRQTDWAYREPLEPIEDAIAKFRDKRSGCRVEKRAELRQRFSTQAWRAQLDILRAFLDNDTLTDTVAVVELMDAGYWQHMHEALPAVAKGAELEQLRSLLFARAVMYLRHKEVATFALRHLPEDKVLEHVEAIERAVGYRRVCVRLQGSASWRLDRTRLDDMSYLYVMAETSGEVTDEEAEGIVCRWLTETPFDEMMWDKAPRLVTQGVEISLTDIREVSMAVRNVGKLGKWRVVRKIMELDGKAQRLINDELMRDASRGFAIVGTHERETHYRRRFVEIAKSLLLGRDVTEAEQTLERLKAGTPGLDRLICRFGLRPVEGT